MFFRQIDEILASGVAMVQCLTTKRANFSTHSTPKFQIHFSQRWLGRFQNGQRMVKAEGLGYVK